MTPGPVTVKVWKAALLALKTLLVSIQAIGWPLVFKTCHEFVPVLARGKIVKQALLSMKTTTWPLVVRTWKKFVLQSTTDEGAMFARGVVADKAPVTDNVPMFRIPGRVVVPAPMPESCKNVLILAAFWTRIWPLLYVKARPAPFGWPIWK